MKFAVAVLVSCVTAGMALSHPADAGELEQIIQELHDNEAPVDGRQAPLLLPFAMEWDRQAGKHLGGGAAEIQQYELLTSQDESRFKASIEALVQNKALVEHLSKQETQEAFDKAYEQARSSHSSVGRIPYRQAMQYWVLSQAAAAGPEALASFPENPQVQWCLPPFIRCTKQRELPEQ